MQILTTGKNLDIGDALRSRIEERLAGNVAKYFDGTVRAHVVVERQKSSFRTECTLHLTTGLTLQAHGDGAGAHGSFDSAAERLEKQLRRYKRRLRDHHMERRRPVAMPPGEAMLDDTDDSELQESAPAIIAETPADLPKLSVADAVSRLDSLPAPFVVFRNGRNGGVNLMYRRSDGLVGWMDLSNPAEN